MVGVAEREELIGADDATLLDGAVRERRVFVTRDYSSIRSLLIERLELEVRTWGVIFLSPALPQGKIGIAAVSRALEAMLRQHPEDDTLLDREVWIGPG